MINISLQGNVISGKKRGRGIGFPTANVQIPQSERRNCKEGTYAGRVTIDKEVFMAAIFIPHLRDVIEAYILDFEGDLYDCYITIDICEHLRDNTKFENLEQLKEQITKDVTEVRSLDLLK